MEWNGWLTGCGVKINALLSLFSDRKRGCLWLSIASMRRDNGNREMNALNSSNSTLGLVQCFLKREKMPAAQRQRRPACGAQECG